MRTDSQYIVITKRDTQWCMCIAGRRGSCSNPKSRRKKARQRERETEQSGWSRNATELSGQMIRGVSWIAEGGPGLLDSVCVCLAHNRSARRRVSTRVRHDTQVRGKRLIRWRIQPAIALSATTPYPWAHHHHHCDMPLCKTSCRPFSRALPSSIAYQVDGGRLTAALPIPPMIHHTMHTSSRPNHFRLHSLPISPVVFRRTAT